MRKRFLAVLLCLCMAICLLPTAAFADNTVTVTFDMNGHGATAVPKQTIAPGTAVTEPAKPVAVDGDKYDFWYWSVYPNGINSLGHRETWDFTKPVTEDMTLYAQWDPWARLSLVLSLNNAAYSGAAAKAIRKSDNMEFDLTENETGKYSCLLPQGVYGIYINGFQQATENIEIGGPKETISWLYFYPLTLQGNGQTFASGNTSEVQLVQSDHFPDIPATPAATDPKYQFVGWTVGPEASSASFDFGKRTHAPATAYAQWVEVGDGEYAVSVVGTGVNNGGSFKATQSSDYTTTLTPNADYKYPGHINQITVGGTDVTSVRNYTFNTATGELTINKSVITGDIVIKASMTPTPYPVTYMPNGGSGANYINYVSVGSTMAIFPSLQDTGFTAPTDRPYFKGWCESADGSGSIYKENAWNFDPQETTYYAIWWKGVDSISISSSPGQLQTGTTTVNALSATVNGASGISQAVTWSIAGASSPQTAVNANGDITVAENETAKTITVRATSTADADKYAEKTIAIIKDTTAPVLTPGTVDRTSDTAATVKFTSSEAGQYFYEIVSKGDTAPTIITTETGTACDTAEQTIALTLTSGAKDIYIVAKDTTGNVTSPALKITIPAYDPGPPPIDPPASDNSISGITAGQVYTLGDTVTFTATGAGMSNTSPNMGDKRWRPTAWETNPAGTWSDAPYSASFSTTGMTVGEHTLTVTFTQQQYNGSAWENVSPAIPYALQRYNGSASVDVSPTVTDTKSVSFTVAAIPVPVITRNLPDESSAKMGDSTTLSIKATTTKGVLTYQWYKDGAAISGATGDSYTISKAASGDADNYYCIVTNTLNGQTATAQSNTTKLTITAADNSQTGDNPQTGDNSRLILWLLLLLVSGGAAVTLGVIAKRKKTQG